MATSSIRDSDDTPNIGKILVLSKGHKLKKSEIKKLTRAEDVLTVKDHLEDYCDELDNLIGYSISSALHTLGVAKVGTINCYRIIGDSPVSDMLPLKTDKFIMAITLSFDSLKRLKNACLTLDLIMISLRNLKSFYESHNSLVNFMVESGTKNNLSEHTNQIIELKKFYALEDLKNQLSAIKSLIENRW